MRLERILAIRPQCKYVSLAKYFPFSPDGLMQNTDLEEMSINEEPLCNICWNGAKFGGAFACPPVRARSGSFEVLQRYMSPGMTSGHPRDTTPATGT